MDSQYENILDGIRGRRLLAKYLEKITAEHQMTAVSITFRITTKEYHFNQQL